MKERTTLGVGGPCRIGIFPGNVRSAETILKEATIPLIGRGSNLVVGDRGIELALFTERMKNIVADGNFLTAECGVSLPRLARRARDLGLGGLEFASGIPGSVGGALRMNAGAYGSEIGNLVVSATLATQGGARTFLSEDLGFGYRSSKIDGIGAVLSATFCLSPRDRSEIDEITARLASLRRSSAPKERSAGSFFKRVDGVSAGYYVDRAGLKGLSVGGAEVSRKHAGYVVNTGSATASDVVELARIIKEEVKKRFDLALIEEVCYYGEF